MDTKLKLRIINFFPVIALCSLVFFSVNAAHNRAGESIDASPTTENATEDVAVAQNAEFSQTFPESHDGAPISHNGEEGFPDSSASPSENGDSVIGLILSGGIVGHIIILLSVVAVALMIEHFLTIREKNLIPPDFAESVAQKLQAGQWNEASRQCHEHPSVLAMVLTAGLSECDLGWNSVERAVEDAVGEQAARLYRKTEYLNLIGNIAPMLGLLGTVIGMIMAFRDLATDTEGYQRAGDLAQGIYLALVTTVEGLIVAIPALGAYAIFNNRIAILIAETTYVAEQILRPVKRKLRSARPAGGVKSGTKEPVPASRT